MIVNIWCVFYWGIQYMVSKPNIMAGGQNKQGFSHLYAVAVAQLTNQQVGEKFGLTYSKGIVGNWVKECRIGSNWGQHGERLVIKDKCQK